MLTRTGHARTRTRTKPTRTRTRTRTRLTRTRTRTRINVTGDNWSYKTCKASQIEELARSTVNSFNLTCLFSDQKQYILQKCTYRQTRIISKLIYKLTQLFNRDS